MEIARDHSVRLMVRRAEYEAENGKNAAAGDQEKPVSWRTSFSAATLCPRNESTKALSYLSVPRFAARHQPSCLAPLAHEKR